MKARTSLLSRRQVLLAGVAALGGCAIGERTPPLAELYGRATARQPRPPLIVIPGAFGSVIRRRSTGEEIWPRSGLDLLFGRYRGIELDIDPGTLEPVTADYATDGPFLGALGQDFYRSLLSTLELAGGYTPDSPGLAAPVPESAYYVYDYDWRLDMVDSVRGLHELIERIAERHGDARLKVDIVGHSNGGMIARYYARYGVADMLSGGPAQRGVDGSERIRRLLLVGTPNLGTIHAVLSLVRGEDVGIRNVPPEVVVTCPAVAQLMPHPDQSWLLDLRGNPVDLDLFDIATWRQLRWSVFDQDLRDRIVRKSDSRRDAEAHLETLEAFLTRQLDRGRRFHEVLGGVARPDEPKPHVFGGDCAPTLARLLANPEGPNTRPYERGHRIPGSQREVDYAELIFEPGDSVVTRGSLLRQAHATDRAAIEPLEIADAVFLCETHRKLGANANLQDNLLSTLL